MRAWLRDNSLSVFFFAIFVAAVAGQSLAGQRAYNAEQSSHGEPGVTYLQYLTSPDFGEALMENWQSEYLQFTLFILATIWLVQRGSNESKPPQDIGTESDQRQLVGGHAQANSPLWAKVGGWRTHLYSNSLLIVMAAIFFASWLGQSVNGWRAYNDELAEHGEAAIGWTSYFAGAEFWEMTLQNWQSEFLAVGTMAVYTIYLRQRGSPESKPVGAPHDQTGTSG
jgi:Domain of unknown function (DUF6766)